MNIYKVYRTDRPDYDSYDSFICLAHDENEAKNLQPESEPVFENTDYKKWRYPGWVKDISFLKVEFIGEAADVFDKPKVLLSSYNAA